MVRNPRPLILVPLLDKVSRSRFHDCGHPIVEPPRLLGYCHPLFALGHSTGRSNGPHPPARSLGANRPLEEHGRRELLAVGGLLVNPPHHLHALDHSAKCSKSLAVRITSAAEVEFGLVADTDEKLVACGFRPITSHRDCSIHVPQARIASTFQRDWRQELRLAGRVRRRLDHFDLHRVVRLVRQGDRPVKCAVRVSRSRQNIDSFLSMSTGRPFRPRY